MSETPQKELAYYLTMFKVEGHSTWRAHLAQSKEGFADDQKKNWGKHAPTVTETMVMRVDRITGQFQPQ